MHPEYGAGVEEIQGEIPLRDRVEGVGEGTQAELFRSRGGIYGMRCPAKRRSPQWRDVCGLLGRLQPPDVALQGLEVGEQVVGEQYRLGALQVSVTGEHELPVLLRHVHERPHRCEHAAPDLLRRVADEEAEVERHLVIAAASRVQLESDVADQLFEPPLYGGVDILVLQGPGELPRLDLRQNRLETAHELVRFLRLYYPLFTEPLRRPARPVRRPGLHRPRQDYGSIEALERFRRRSSEPAAPEGSPATLAHGPAV